MLRSSLPLLTLSLIILEGQIAPAQQTSATSDNQTDSKAADDAAATTREVVAAPFYPLHQGAAWHYKMIDSKGNERDMTNKVAKLENIDDRQLYRVETLLDGQIVATEHLSQTPKGLFRNRFNGAVLSPPLPLLKNPIQRGSKWETKTLIGAQELTIRCNVEADQVEIPAGKYKAVKLTVATSVDDTKILSDYWFAANVGIVKQEMDIGGQKVKIILQKYVPGKTQPPPADQPAKAE